MSFRRTIGRLSLLSLALIILSTPLRAQSDDRSADKLDQGLDNADQTYPVFVRMQDQLFYKGGDYEKFCKDHQNDKRSALRKLVLQTLRDKSDRSWDQVKNKVESLVKDNDVRHVTRYWIVNGFACEATGKACRALAKDEAVSFVYLQRGPVRQHQKTGPTKLTDEQHKALEKIRKEWQDDSDQEFTAKDLEVPWNLKKIQADQVWEKEGATGKGVVVAVADTGLLMAPPLVRALWKNSKEELTGKDADGNGYVDDVFGYDFAAQSAFALGDPGMPHGSACAGIIAGRPVPEKRLVTGVAPRAHIMMLRGMGYLKSYEYALANGADVISMSYMWVRVEQIGKRGSVGSWLYGVAYRIALQTRETYRTCPSGFASACRNQRRGDGRRDGGVEFHLGPEHGFDGGVGKDTGLGAEAGRLGRLAGSDQQCPAADPGRMPGNANTSFKWRKLRSTSISCL